MRVFIGVEIPILPIIDVVIPVYNEEQSLGSVLGDIPKELVRGIIVCDNGSNDGTAQIAKDFGATVVSEPRKGYGSACLAGLAHIAATTKKPAIVVFMDGDYSDYGEELARLIEPILYDEVDMVIGSRALGKMERGSMTVPQVFGNWLATRLLRLYYGYKFTDLGPFRAIRYDKLVALKMEDRNFGWTVEMQIKAAKQKLKCEEVPVSYRRRIGVSKVSGTVRGTIMAGYKILWTLYKYR